MKKLTYFILLTLIIPATLSAQYDEPCLPEGITFTTQEQIDNFQTDYPNCTEIKGNVEIHGNDITNLTGLNAVTAIQGDIEIVQNVLLTSLAGFDNVNYIGGDLIIGGPYGQGNPSLTSLSGLENLVSIGGDLGLAENDLMTSLSGLDNLTNIGGALKIGMKSHHQMHGNAALTNLSGLDNLTTIGSDILILKNNSLNSLSGLESITYIEGTLKIWANPSLSSLSGLNNAMSIGYDLSFLGNDSLVDLSGLENLTSIGNSLIIGGFFWGGNSSLISLSGLDNVTSIGGDLNISNNISLSTCEVQSICDYLLSPNGIVEIYGNAEGCNNQEEVEEECETVDIDVACLSDQLSIYPNPFSTSTTIEYELKQAGKVELKIFNQLGELIEVVQKTTKPGKQTFIWDASNLPQGVYFVRLQLDNELVTKKIIKLN